MFHMYTAGWVGQQHDKCELCLKVECPLLPESATLSSEIDTDLSDLVADFIINVDLS